VAYFERFGSNGFAALETVIAEANSAGLCVIADAKRGDIGTTMDGYASAWLGEGSLGCHAMTVSPYLGFDALEPAFESAEATGSTVFVLAATSNRNAEFIQQVQSDGLAIAHHVVHAARNRSSNSLTVGVVVGATRPLAESGLTPESLQGLLVLAPGFGAQGALMSDVGEMFGSAAEWVIPTVSRSVVANGASGVGAAIDGHRQELGL
jgi:orotidine-5'-phosphate decarboxylase